MTPAPRPRVAGLRGASVGLLTVSLAVGAHGVAGGGVPGQHGVVGLVAVGAVLGALSAVVPGLRRGTAGLLLVLGASQYLAHRTLGALMAADHPSAHGAAGHGAMNPGAMNPGAMPPGAAGPGPVHEGPLMLLAHVVAVLACVLLVRSAERVAGAVAPALRRVLPALGLLLTAPEPPSRPASRRPRTTPVLCRRLPLVRFAPRRGPPAGLPSPC